jgi:hypothetical protein
MPEIIRNSRLVSAKGGLIDYVSADGELLMQVAVPPGNQSANEYLDLCPDDCEMQVSKGLAVIYPRSHVAVQANPLALESSANPDFISTGAAAEHRRMLITVGIMQQNVDKQIEARLAAFSLVEPVKPVEVPEKQPTVEPLEPPPDAKP